nr:thiol peroxidase [uncultured Anaeromusa sp.]
MEKRTGYLKMKGTPLTLLGRELKVGEKAPDFQALTQDLQSFSLSNTAGKLRIISVVPSIDTPVCDAQTRFFNQDASKFPDVAILSISVDLPFAIKRYCAAQGIENLTTLSDHKSLDFGGKYGFVIEELRLLSRGVIVIDKDDIIRYIQYVPNVEDTPDFDSALAAVKALS